MSDKKSPWIVEVVEDATDKVVERIPARSEREAERIERGLDINLNHERFTVRVVFED